MANPNEDSPLTDPMYNLNYSEPGDKKMQILVLFAGIATILKHGILAAILGIELFLSRRNKHKMLKELEKCGFGALKFEESLDSLFTTLVLSIFIFLSAILSFFFLIARCRKFKSSQRLFQLSTILIVFTFELGTSIINDMLRIKTDREDLARFFMFRNNDLYSNFNYLFILYAPAVIQVNLTVICLFARGSIDAYNTVDLNKIPSGKSLFGIDYIPSYIKYKIEIIIARFLIPKESILVAKSHEFEHVRTLVKRGSNIYFTNFVLTNYTGQGLVGNFLVYLQNIYTTGSIASISSILNGIVILSLAWLIDFSAKLNNPLLGIICSVRISNFLEFLFTLLVNRAQRSLELEIDKKIVIRGDFTPLIEYFKQRSLVENAYFSNIVSFISPYNSLVFRYKNITNVIKV